MPDLKRSMFLEYVCPRCKGALVTKPDAFECPACAACYPVVVGIPDFRVFPDPYISIEEDHKKGLRLEERARAGFSFEELVRFYWSITPDEPAEMAKRFTAQAIAAADRGRHLLHSQSRVTALLEIKGSRALDVGSRTGGLLVATAEKTSQVIGIDIAFRWLIIARKRLEESGREAQLVCCCAEFLPFKAESFNVVLAENVWEHTERQQSLADEAARVLSAKGIFFATTWNRLAAAPEPHVRLWGVGLLPRAWAQRYVKWRKNVGYEHVRLLSVFQIKQMLRRANFKRVTIDLPSFGAGELANVSLNQRRIIKGYQRVKSWPILRSALQIVAPVLHVTGERGTGGGPENEPNL